jgi:hypothetical protein
MVKEQIHKYKIVRETSPYNKYIKWFYRDYREDGTAIISFGYKTQKEARQFAENKHNTSFPIGNKIYKIVMQEIKNK